MNKIIAYAVVIGIHKAAVAALAEAASLPHIGDSPHTVVPPAGGKGGGSTRAQHQSSYSSTN